MTNYIALAIPFFFLLMGVELWAARRRGARLYRFNDALVLAAREQFARSNSRRANSEKVRAFDFARHTSRSPSLSVQRKRM